MPQEILFIYGSLKRGFHNHTHLLGVAKYAGLGATLEKYALYVNGSPAVIKHEKISKIFGELFVIHSLTLEDIDRIKGHPNWYRREKVEILAENGRVVLAWVYFFPKKRGELVEAGYYGKST